MSSATDERASRSGTAIGWRLRYLAMSVFGPAQLGNDGRPAASGCAASASARWRRPRAARLDHHAHG